MSFLKTVNSAFTIIRTSLSARIKQLQYEYNAFVVQTRCSFRPKPHLKPRERNLSVILLSFNRFEDTRNALKYLYRNTKLPFELVVLDNGSTADTVKKLKKELSKYNNVVYLEEKKNLGAAKGKYKAAQHAHGNYLMFIDNDMRVMPNYMEHLLTRLESDNKLVAVCAKVLFPNKRIQFTGGFFNIENGYIFHGLIDNDKHYMDPSTTGEGQICDWVPGGATLWKRDLYFKFPIDNKMDGSYEDNEVCLRIKKAGFKVGTASKAVCIHYHYTFKPETFLVREKTYLKDRYHEQRLQTGLVRYFQIHKLIFVFGSIEGTWTFVQPPEKKAITQFIKKRLLRS